MCVGAGFAFSPYSVCDDSCQDILLRNQCKTCWHKSLDWHFSLGALLEYADTRFFYISTTVNNSWLSTPPASPHAQFFLPKRVRSGLLRVPAAGFGGVLSDLELVQHDERLRARGPSTGGLHLGNPRYVRTRAPRSTHAPDLRSPATGPRDTKYDILDYFVCVFVFVFDFSARFPVEHQLLFLMLHVARCASQFGSCPIVVLHVVPFSLFFSPPPFLRRHLIH